MEMPKNGHKELYFVSDRLLSQEEIDNFTGRISVIVSQGPYLRNYRIIEGLFGHSGHVVYYPKSRVKDGKVNFGGNPYNPFVSDWKEPALSELEKVAIEHNLKAETK